MSDKEILNTRCYLCHKNLRKKVRWFSPNGKHYYSVSYCDTHGYMKAKIRIRKTENGQIYVVKTKKLISGEELETIREKKEQVKRQKKEKRAAKNQNHRG